jgi:hypothetical protein
VNLTEMEALAADDFNTPETVHAKANAFEEAVALLVECREVTKAIHVHVQLSAFTKNGPGDRMNALLAKLDGGAKG